MLGRLEGMLVKGTAWARLPELIDVTVLHVVRNGQEQRGPGLIHRDVSASNQPCPVDQ